ncbi:MAG: TlpA disulfide reductase family protein [Ignavibacteriaceae bacterium]
MLKLSGTLCTILLAGFLFNYCTPKEEFKSKFAFYPEKPEPGEEITVMYVSDSTSLAGSDSIDMIIHLHNYDLDTTFSIEMIKEGIGWKGKFRSSGNHFGALVKFKHAEKSDNNDNQGYFINFYESNNTLIPGALAGSAVSISSWGAFYADLERNRERAFELFNKEFESNPALEREFISPYLLTFVTLYPEKSDSIYQTLAEKTEQYSDLKEKEINLLITYYGMTNFYNQEKVDTYINMMKEKFPAGEYMQNDYINRMRTETDIDKKVQMVQEFELLFPESKFSTLPYDLAANAYRDVKDYNSAFQYLKTNQDKVSPFRFYYIASRMLEEKADLQTAMMISESGIQQTRKNLLDENSSREKHETVKDAIEMKETALAYSLLVNGKILNELNKKPEALNSFEEMVSITKSTNPELNEVYAKSLVENEKFETAMTQIENYLRSGTHTPIMKDLLRTAYIEVKGSDSGFDEYISEFESLAKEKLFEKLNAELISKPAPQFSLVDLNGNTVSLSELKGKTVMIDFWATWCGPCISSFPGLQQTVNSFADDPDVRFLFINSWERVENKKQNASDFIKKNNYTFQVLMDEENKVITDYKVTGIPTKFIIDKDQNIRFISVGYAGTPEGLVEEISAMIEMIK